MNEFVKSIKETSTPYGTAALWWLGQMGLIVKAGDTAVCIVYFASEHAEGIRMKFPRRMSRRMKWQ